MKANDKYQNSNTKINSKFQCQMSKQKLFCHLVFVLWYYFVICALVFVITPAYGKEITILYTGESHAMLYPCTCPIESDGGVARRATLLKELKKKYPDSLILDSGGFFAGGALDEYSQNSQLDSQRTLINLKAMELMQYDAAAIGDDEFNFGRGFWQENIEKTKIPMLSCNIKSDKVSPYTLKEVAGLKIGIIGVTTLAAMPKAEGLQFIEPKIAVASASSALRKAGANLIVLLSHLGESEDLNLIKEVKDIDILITGHSRAQGESSSKVENTLILRPSWQARHLGKASFTLTDNKVSDYNVEELRLSDKIADDPDILAILPRCFSDTNCKKEGFIGTCQEPGSLNARCVFSQANKVNLLIITSHDCISCNTTTVVNFLEKQFSGLVVSYLYYPAQKANDLLKEFSISGLPAYLLAKEVEKEKNFDNLKERLEQKGDYYLLKPEFAGLSYFYDRKKIKGKLDLFISLYDKNTDKLLEVIREFNPEIHFLAVEQEGRFDAARGNLEVEEDLRALCIQKYYPEIFFDYITCRTKNINSSWWEECAVKLDIEKIKACARSNEGTALLRENISLGKELKLMFGPVYLMDNQEVFSSKEVPAKEELKKILGR